MYKRQVFRNRAFLFLTFIYVLTSCLFYNIYISYKFAVFTNWEVKRCDLLAVEFSDCLLYTSTDINKSCHVFFLYSTFWICSLTFSISVFRSMAMLEISRSLDLDKIVFASLFISCAMKSSLRPMPSFSVVSLSLIHI